MTSRIYRAWRIADHEWIDEEPVKPGLTVFEPDRVPRKTGLLDAQGNELVAMDVAEPIGFVRFGEGWNG